MDLAKELQQELFGYLTKNLDIETYGDIDLIPTGIEPLDTMLGGGIGLGTLTVATGYSGSFKSTLAVEVAKAFKKYDPRTVILYIDTESSMSIQRLRALGLSDIDKTLTGFTVEKVFSTIFLIEQWKQKKIEEDKSFADVPILIIWDSIANTPSAAELKTLDVNQTLGLKARILSSNLPKIIEVMRRNKISLYAINQFRDKVQIGPFNSPSELKHLQHDKTMPGGQALLFNASQLLEFRTVEHKLPEESKFGFRHAIIEVKTVKNKFFPDGIKVQLVLNVGKGVDKLFTTFQFLVSTKRIKTGAWNYLETYPQRKFRTKELPDVYNSDPKFREEYNKVLKETLEEWKKKLLDYQVSEMILDDTDQENESHEILDNSATDNTVPTNNNNDLPQEFELHETSVDEVLEE